MLDQIVYLSYTLSGCKDIGFRKLEFEAKTQFIFFISKLFRICNSF